MNILITGVNGFLGSNFVKLLKNNNIHIVGIDKHKCQSTLGFEYYCIDIKTPFFIKRHFDYIFHFAALSRTNVNSNYSYSEIYDINVKGTMNTIRSSSFDKFVFLSSALLYDRKTKYITETSPLKINSYYSKTKYKAENFIKKTLAKDQYIILRPVNLAGENQDKVAAIPVFFWQAIHNENINIFVPSNKSMQFLHIDDFTSLLQKILYQKIDGIFNVSSDESINIIDLAEKIIHICNSKSRIICSNPCDDNLSIIDSGKIRKLTNWEPSIGIEEILLRFKKSNHDNNHLFMIGDGVKMM